MSPSSDLLSKVGGSLAFWIVKSKKEFDLRLRGDVEKLVRSSIFDAGILAGSTVSFWARILSWKCLSSTMKSYFLVCSECEHRRCRLFRNPNAVAYGLGQSDNNTVVRARIEDKELADPWSLPGRQSYDEEKLQSCVGEYIRTGQGHFSRYSGLTFFLHCGALAKVGKVIVRFCSDLVCRTDSTEKFHDIPVFCSNLDPSKTTAIEPLVSRVSRSDFACSSK